MRRSLATASFLIGFCVAGLVLPISAEEEAPDTRTSDVAEPDSGASSDVSDVSDVSDASDASDASDVSGASLRASVPPPPIGVRFGEPLEGERFRFVYRFERTKKQGLMVGTRDRSASQVLPPNSFNPYDRTPRSLNVTIHDFQLFYSPHPRVTLVVDVPFIQKELVSRLDTGISVENQTEGVGDVDFAIVLPFIRKGKENSHVHVAINVPTGSIRRGGDETRLPFDNQIGNGTVDLEWGWTYRGEMDWLSWGGQAWGRHPVGRNGLHYREGSRFEASLWSGVRILPGVSASIRLSWEKKNNIRQNQSDPITDPSDNSKARGFTRLSVSPGLAIDVPQWGNQRLSVEVDVPFHQDLDGPQLEKDWSVQAGWQWSF